MNTDIELQTRKAAALSNAYNNLPAEPNTLPRVILTNRLTGEQSAITVETKYIAHGMADEINATGSFVYARVYI